jgi:leader peptidase (prepilin peptidase)/N-methyltransferase
LPLSLTRLAWAAMIVAGVVAYALGADWPSLLRAAAGAALALLLYLIVWLASSGGFGFGDVRFAPLVGAPAAAHSWSLLIWALLLGSVAGAAWGVLRMLRGHRGSYPYAPWLLVGAYLACAIAWVG